MQRNKIFAFGVTLGVMLLVIGSWILFSSVSLTSEGVQGQKMLGQGAAPGRPVDWKPVEIEGLVDLGDGAYAYPPVRPVVVNLADVPEGVRPEEGMYERWRRGEIELDEGESILSEAEIAELKVAALALPSSEKANTARNGPKLEAPSPAGTAFDSINFNEAGGSVPPDIELAAGPNHLIGVVNVAFEIYNKSGTSLVGPTSFNSFFGSVGAGCTSNSFDPNVLYDEAADRFMMATDGNGTHYCIAVSQTGDPTGSWNLYAFGTNVNSNFFDYPHAGVGRDAIYMGANMFASSFAESRVWAFDKAAMYAGASASAVTRSTGSDFTPQPLNLHGVAQGTWPSSGPHYLLMSRNFNGATYVLYSWDDPFGTNSFVAESVVNLPASHGVSVGYPVDVPQAGSSAFLQGNDYRPLDFEYRNGSGWTTMTVSCNPGSGTVDCLQWGEINLASGALVQAGIYASNSNYRIFPNIAADDCGNAALGYTKSSTSIYPSIWVTGRESGDALGTLQAEVQLKAGEIAYTAFDGSPHRWGDYTGMTVDPNGSTFWYMGEYSKNTGTSSGRWGTYIGSFSYGSCNSNSGDAYEPDNESSQANWITNGSAQTHSIVPADDQDWVKFSLSADSAVTLETSGTSGDTRMWLYNSSLTEIEYDDDDGSSTFSLIDRVCDVDALPAGTYYVKVDEYGNNDEIASYNLSFTRTTCPATQLPDLRITSMRIELERGGQCYIPSSSLGVRVWFENAGQANAGPFVVEVNGVQQSVSAGLATGEATSLWFMGYESGQNSAFVDANTQVTESDENNNQLTQYLAVPTPPITCTNTPTPSATPTNTPTPSATPTNTPTPSPSGNVDLILSPASVNTGVGQTFDVAIEVEAGNQQVDGAAAYLNFNPTYLEVVSISGGNAFSLEIVNQFDNSAGHVDFAAGSVSNLPSGTFTLATVTFEAKAQTNSSPITFNSASPRLSDATFGGNSVLDSMTGNTVTVHNAVLNGSVTFQGRPTAPHADWAMPLDVSLTVPGNSTPAYQFSPTTDQSGDFSLTGMAAGTYEIRVKHSHTLQVMQTVTLAGSNTIDFGTLREGDANNDNQVTLVDFSILATTFGRCEGTTGFDGRADFNEDGCIALTDFSLLATNFGQAGQGTPAQAPSAPSQPNANVVMSISPAQSSIKPGDTFNVTVRLDAGEQQVDGAQIVLNFDPAMLAVEEVMTGDKLALELANQVDNEGGTIQFAAGTLEAFPSGVIDVIDIQFRALQAGETTLAFDADGAMGSDVTFAGASVLGSHADGVVTVNEPTAVRVRELAAPATTGWLWVIAPLAMMLLAGGIFLVRKPRRQ